MTLTYGSLFSGYGGLGMAVEMVTDARCAWHSEIEPAAITVHEAHWPDAPNLGDISTVDWSTVPPVDLICAGWPCQPFSTAGRRQGTDDERHLWPYVLDALRSLRPRYLFGENVAGHLSLGFERVLADLASIGFDAEWVVVRASDAGAPHRRERLFVLASDADGAGAGGGVGAVPRSLQGQAQPDVCPAVDGGAGAAATFGPYATAITQGELSHADQPEDRPGEVLRDVRRRNGAQAVQRPLGGSRRVPAPTELLAVLREQSGGRDQGRPSLASPQAPPADMRDVRDIRATARSPQGSQPEQQRSQQPRNAVCFVSPDAALAGGRPDSGAWGPYQLAVERWARIIGRPAPRPTDSKGRLSPLLTEWMMGLPAGWVTGHGLARTAELKMLGNGVVPQQGALALSLLADRLAPVAVAS